MNALEYMAYTSAGDLASRMQNNVLEMPLKRPASR